jgi:acyl phosphate:glycerol-3-phosphate acyltransferase
MEQHIHLILVSALIILLTLMASRNVLLPVMVYFSFMVIVIPLYFGINIQTLITVVVLLALTIISVWLAKRKSILELESNAELKKWRIIARPFALLFIPLNIYLGHRFLLYLLGILSMLFMLTDLYRLISNHNLSLFYKKTENRRFSSMTSFVVAMFIVFLLFPPEVAYLCLIFVIFGDLAGKLIGLKYGRKKILHNRTLSGSLGFITGCIFSGFVLLLIFDIKFPYLLIGALCATLSELFSNKMDDNFTVGILTGACLVALQYFGVIKP